MPPEMSISMPTNVVITAIVGDTGITQNVAMMIISKRRGLHVKKEGGTQVTAAAVTVTKLVTAVETIVWRRGTVVAAETEEEEEDTLAETIGRRCTATATNDAMIRDRLC